MGAFEEATNNIDKLYSKAEETLTVKQMQQLREYIAHKFALDADPDEVIVKSKCVHWGEWSVSSLKDKICKIAKKFNVDVSFCFLSSSYGFIESLKTYRITLTGKVRDVEKVFDAI